MAFSALYKMVYCGCEDCLKIKPGGNDKMSEQFTMQNQNGSVDNIEVSVSIHKNGKLALADSQALELVIKDCLTTRDENPLLLAWRDTAGMYLDQLAQANVRVAALEAELARANARSILVKTSDGLYNGIVSEAPMDVFLVDSDDLSATAVESADVNVEYVQSIAANF